MVKMLLASGVRTYGRERSQYLSALEFACENGHLVVARMLRSHCQSPTS